MGHALFNTNALVSFTALYSFKDGTVGPTAVAGDHGRPRFYRVCLDKQDSEECRGFVTLAIAPL